MHANDTNMRIDLENLTIQKATEAFRSGEFSPSDLTDVYLAEIEKKNPGLNAYLTIFEDGARKQAEESTKRYKNGNPLSDIDGIPLAIKDNILVAGERTSAGSKILENYKASYDATVIARLGPAGAVFLGHSNMDEFAMGSSNEHSAFGPVRNPLDPERVPGGSSGGSAAAVAANLCLAALGSDTGGSIRQPASFCGVVGLKPTYGAVSRYGLIALASSLDQIGSMAKTVEDAEIIFRHICGKDDKDATSRDYPSLRTTNYDLQTITIGFPEDFPMQGVEPAVLKNLEESKEKLKSLGFKLKPVKLPYSQYAVASYYVILPAEASANLARYDGIRYGLYKPGENLVSDYMGTRAAGLGPEVRRRIMIGTYVLSAGYYEAYYNQATAVRSMIGKDFERAFSEIQAIVTPTTPGPAFKLGEKGDDPLKMYLEDLFTIPANLVGVPAISVPSGEVKVGGKGLPLGLQIIAPSLREDILFDIAKKFLA